MEQSDEQELLLHKLGYSPTQYSLYLVPNSALWAGLTPSNITKLSSTSCHSAHENIGTLLFDRGRHFSLVLATKSGEERDNDVISEGEEYSTPKKQCDTLLREVGESGYSTNHSSTSIAAAQPASDVIITSSPQSKPAELECAKLNESCSTIIVSDSEDDEDPLSLKSPALPGLHTHRLQPPASKNDDKSSIQLIDSQYFLPPRPPPHLKHSSPVISNSNSRSARDLCRGWGAQGFPTISLPRAYEVLIENSTKVLEDSNKLIPPSPTLPPVLKKHQLIVLY